MRQRVAIAIAFINKPDLIIADEPTTALDVTIQGQILHLAQELCRETGTAMIWITHDLAIVSALADRIAVMYAGRIVETGATADVVARPVHPYTQGLLGSVPSRQRARQPPGTDPGQCAVAARTCPRLRLPPRCARAAPECASDAAACASRDPAGACAAAGRWQEAGA